MTLPPSGGGVLIGKARGVHRGIRLQQDWPAVTGPASSRQLLKV